LSSEVFFNSFSSGNFRSVEIGSSAGAHSDFQFGVSCSPSDICRPPAQQPLVVALLTATATAEAH
jgi:hypothetical protein